MIGDGMGLGRGSAGEDIPASSRFASSLRRPHFDEILKGISLSASSRGLDGGGESDLSPFLRPSPGKLEHPWGLTTVTKLSSLGVI